MAVNNVGSSNNAQIKKLLAQLANQQGGAAATGGSSPLAGTTLNGAQKPCGCPGSCNTCA